MPRSLDSLPSELLTAVADHLSRRSICAFRSCSRKTRDASWPPFRNALKVVKLSLSARRVERFHCITKHDDLRTLVDTVEVEASTWADRQDFANTMIQLRYGRTSALLHECLAGLPNCTKIVFFRSYQWYNDRTELVDWQKVFGPLDIYNASHRPYLIAHHWFWMVLNAAHAACVPLIAIEFGNHFVLIMAV